MKFQDAGIFVLKLPSYIKLSNAVSRLKNRTIDTLVQLFQRKAQADPIRRPLAITYSNTDAEENRYLSEYVLRSGDRYTGHWKVVNGRYITREGWGKCQYASGGGTYEGGWMDGKRHGHGVQRWADGSEYFGDWKNDKRDGKGKQTYKGGAKYAGYWKDDNRCGYGQITYPDGEEYMGNWKDDCRHGDSGTKIWPDGRRYTGSWAEGKRSGHGTMKWPDGREYIGEWKKDVRAGHGVYTSSNGRKKTGDWRNDKLIAVTKGSRQQEPAYMASWAECQPSVPGRGLPQFVARR